MLHCTTREPDPFAGVDDDGVEPAVICHDCFDDVEGEGDAFTVLGEAYCANCAVDEISRLRQEEWGALTEKDHVDLLEELAGAAERERVLLQASIRSRKAVR